MSAPGTPEASSPVSAHCNLAAQEPEDFMQPAVIEASGVMLTKAHSSPDGL